MEFSEQDIINIASIEQQRNRKRYQNVEKIMDQKENLKGFKCVNIINS